MTKEQFDLVLRLEGVFMPYAREQREMFYAGPDGAKPYARFVHYAQLLCETCNRTKGSAI